MELLLLAASLGLSVTLIVLVIFFLVRKPADQSKQLELSVREEFRLAREESAKASRELREEIGTSQKSATEMLVKTISELGKTQSENLKSLTVSGFAQHMA